MVTIDKVDKKTRPKYMPFTGNYKFNDIGRLKVKG